MLIYHLFALVFVAVMARKYSAKEILRAAIKVGIIAYIVMGLVFAQGIIRKIAFRSVIHLQQNNNNFYNSNPLI
ncbi:MAG: hypothetical protein KJ620_03895 [Candidatus Edwardsbacteria bacterium]|nr:hypothetical protein [Candidatus Edwardsbacteria bacterium]MBU1577773.1 hypothetical protein [Candidatus Edwardsbacteria bacterium]MBU2462457.1 hypothetical protein [Candidatus Edwardsbacteria bacterium]